MERSQLRTISNQINSPVFLETQCVFYVLIFVIMPACKENIER